MNAHSSWGGFGYDCDPYERWEIQNRDPDELPEYDEDGHPYLITFEKEAWIKPYENTEVIIMDYDESIPNWNME